MAPLTVQKRGQILAIFAATANASLTARKCGVSRKTVSLWVQRSLSTGDVLRKKGSGRKAALSSTAAARAVQLLTEVPSQTTSRAAECLEQEGLTPSRPHHTTLARAAKQAAKQSGEPLRCVTGQPAKRLTAGNKTTRLAFAQANRRRRWPSVLFTDRKRFLWRHPGDAVSRSQWVKKGQRRTALTVNHPLAVNVYLGICKWGCTPCKKVAGTSKLRSPFTNNRGEPAKNITSRGYADVLTSTFLPAGNRLFSKEGFASWTLQQDNDPTHRVAARIVKQHSRAHTSKVELLSGWPPNSPDLNPIENLWAILAAEVASKRCKSFEEFQAAVEHACSHVSKRILARLIDSMPKRIAQVIANGGDMTKY
jgi:transposase